MNIVAKHFSSYDRETEEHRKSLRYPLHFQAAVVYHQHKDAATRPTFHGRTGDLSIAGASLVLDHNVFHSDDVTILLAVPAVHPGESKRIIEITAKMVYTVFSPPHDAFRIGLAFQQFKGTSKSLLETILEQRSFYAQDL